MFIKAKVAYDEGDKISLVNIREDLISRIDWIKVDGKDTLWVITGLDAKGVDCGYYITDIHIKDMAAFLEKHKLLIPIEKNIKME